jgi:Cu2+-containing amine oxidase
LLPGRHDGVADSFSNRDLWIMLYHYNEDSRGNQGDAWDDGLSQYLNGENIDGQDVVLWYAGHLAHHSAEGSDEWHEAGPALAPFRNWW